jgi:hypothetical protein
VISLSAAVIASVIVRPRKCTASGYEEVVDELSDDGNFHGNKCGLTFTREELEGIRPRLDSALCCAKGRGSDANGTTQWGFREDDCNSFAENA